MLRINSPGGAVTASDIMYQDLLQLPPARRSKPVVACMMDVAASGGYYLAMGCDRVYAHPTTVTGSIGVIMSLYNASGLFEKLGVTSDPIKSGPNKDIGNPARPMTDGGARHPAGHGQQLLRPVRAGGGARPAACRRSASAPWPTAASTPASTPRSSAWWTRSATWKTPSTRAKAHGLPQGRRRSSPTTAATATAAASTPAMPQIPSEINVKLDVPGLIGNQGGAAFMYLWEPGLREWEKGVRNRFRDFSGNRFLAPFHIRR